jgi:oxysterol-binding protein-related protein 8
VALGRCAPVLQKFLGNSAASIMGGRSTLTFQEHAGENYVITMPNIYAVGLFLGTMTMELADSCTITCQKHDLVAEIDFKFKVRRPHAWRGATVRPTS